VQVERVEGGEVDLAPHGGLEGPLHDEALQVRRERGRDAVEQLGAGQLRHREGEIDLGDEAELAPFSNL
jgi:hypothetical protein